MLSIITINRNNEIGLEKTISSLRMQSNQDFEWIFIDGNSTDLSLALANQFTRVRDRLVSEPDGGIYNAMNKGAMLARGECILFLNSGDIFANENCVDYIQNIFKKNQTKISLQILIVFSSPYPSFLYSLSSLLSPL